MRFGSVCSGIEAASVAFEPLGWSAAWLAEIEPFPSAVLAHHYPDVPNLGDMTAIARRVLVGEVEAPDLLCGGTPCQAFSVAGLRRSLDDARGNLSLVFCEIANAIDSVRAARGDQPSVIFWENVPGLLSTKDNAFGCFLAGLAGEDEPLQPPGGRWANAGCVYGPARAVAWRTLDAQYFGLAQRRRRVFVVASARDGFDPATVLFEWDGMRRDSPPSREAREIAPTIPSRSSGGGGLGTDFDCDGGLICMAHGQGGADGIGVQADHAYTLEASAEVQAVAYTTKLHNTGSNNAGKIFEERTTCLDDNSPPPVLLTTMAVRRLLPEECEKLQGFPAVLEKITIEACLDHQNQSVRVALKCLRWQNSVSHADENELTQPAKTADARSSTSPAHLAPLAALHVRMHSVDELLEIRSAGRLIWSASGAGQSRKSLPPTLTENSVQELARLLREVARTITAGKAESPPSIRLSFPASSGAINAEKSGREMEESASDAMSDQHRATFTTSDLGLITTFSDSTAETLSCFALHAIAGCIPSTTLPETFSIEMTVETPYTAIPWRGKPADQCPDGPRYKALGNSWAVPCVRWIGRRIQHAIRAKELG